jgi:uncharacterized protein (DUF362 family)/NAD-dependent dihydropyrimidine dehydrogenase PreA subunit
MSADVCLRNGLTYERNQLKSNLLEMIEATGGWPAVFRAGAKVLIKVNMLAAKPPEMAITTHPVLVAALAQLLLARGCKVAIGDSPGGAVGGVEKYWSACGYREIADELGLTLDNFESAGSTPREINGITYYISNSITTYDAIINACKFKTHLLCRLTNGIKNSFGIIPGLGKSVIHSYCLRPRDLAVHIVNIYRLVTFDLVVMDGLLSMDGQGPSTDGNPRFEGLLGVARDSVCLDMALSHLTGLGPEGLDIVQEARKQGLGKPWREITVEGSHQFSNFKIPRSSFYNLLPPFLGDLVRPFLKKVPQGNEKCTGCRYCANACPVNAITYPRGQAVMNRSTCIVCLCCHELCPENAVELRQRLRRRK